MPVGKLTADLIDGEPLLALVGLIAHRQDINLAQKNLAPQSSMELTRLTAQFEARLQLRTADLKMVQTSEELKSLTHSVQVQKFAIEEAMRKMMGAEGRLHAAITQANDETNRLVEEKLDLQKAISQAKSDYTKMVRAAEEKYALGMASAKDDFEKGLLDAVARLNAYVDLKAPADYWKQEANDAGKRRDAALSSFMYWSAGMMAGLALLVGASTLFLHFGLKVDPKDLPFYIVPVVGLLLLPAVWIMRHRARLFTDASADQRDAALRQHQAQTYVALVTDRHEKEERLVALTALFRPGPSQPSDEGIPLPIIELLRRGN